MPSRVIEVALIIAIGSIAIALAYTYLLPLLLTTFQTVDVKALESNYKQLLVILDEEGSIKSVYYIKFTNFHEVDKAQAYGMYYQIDFNLDGENLQDIKIPTMSINSNISNYGGFPWINLIGDNRTYALLNKSSFVISGFKYDNNYIYMLYARPSIYILEEEISDKVSIFRIFIMFDKYVLKSSSGVLNEILIGKDTKISVEVTSILKYPPLVWGSEKILNLKISQLCPFFKRDDNIAIGNKEKMNIYEVHIKIINKNVIIGD